jgi:hypothetical protein
MGCRIHSGLIHTQLKIKTDASYIGFFLPNYMRTNVIKKRLACAVPILLLFLMTGCKKEYERPDHYEVDLFANERKEGKAYIMNEEECFDGSEMVIASSAVKLADSSIGRGRPFYIYKVSSGEMMKTVRDTVLDYPFKFLSNQRLKLKEGPIYVYLKKLDGYRFIAEERNIKYQWLKTAPVYSVQKDK